MCFTSALAVGMLCLSACGSKMEPLPAPLPSDRVVQGAGWIVLTNQDLQHLPVAVRLSAGKTADASVAPLALGEASLAATTIPLTIGKGAAKITKTQDVALVFPVSSPVVPLALVASGRAACAMTWQATSATLKLTLRFGRATNGAVDVVLASTPSLEVAPTALADNNGCLSVTGQALTLAAHLRDAAANALVSGYVKAARETVQTVIPPNLEMAVRLGANIHGDSVVVDLQSRYRAVDDQGEDQPGSLLTHNGSFAAIGLDLGLNVSRHRCAVDAPPPNLSVQALPVKAPVTTASGKVLRRALVLDRALLGHIAWAVARSGYLCRGRSRGVEKLLPVNWANNAVPALGALVEAGAVGARFWPGQTPAVRVIDLDGGAGLEWQLPEAVLEMTAPVAGVELVVLRVEGTFRLNLKAQTANGVRLSIVSATVDTAVLSSPVLPQADVSAGPGLSLAVEAALKGIFAGTLGLTPALPASGAVIVGSSRVADQMWLWLDGGALPTLAVE